MLSLIKKIVGTKNDREVKRIRPYVGEINELEAEFQKLSDAELRPMLLQRAKNGSGTLFDPRVVEAYLTLGPQGH